MNGLGILFSLVAIAFIILESTFLKKKHIPFWLALLGSQVLVTVLEFTEFNSVVQLFILVAAFLLLMLSIKELLAIILDYVRLN